MSSRNAGFRCVPRGVFVTKQWNRERQRTSNFPSMITRTMVWHTYKQTCKQTQTNKEGILWIRLLLTWYWVVPMGIAYFEFFMDCTSSDKVRNWHLHWTECAHFSTLMLFTLPCLCTWKLELVFSLQGEIDQQLNSLGIQRHDWESRHRAHYLILSQELREAVIYVLAEFVR